MDELLANGAHVLLVVWIVFVVLASLVMADEDDK